MAAFQTQQRFRPLAPAQPPQAPTIGDPAGVSLAMPGQAPVLKPAPTTGGPAPLDPTLPGAGSTRPVPPPTGQRPGGPVPVDPTTGDPTFGRPTFPSRPPTPGLGPTGKPPVTVEGSGIKPTRPATPVTQRPPVVPPTPGRVEPLKPIAPETSPVGGNLRGDVYLPGDDARLRGAQGRTDAAGQAIAGANRQGMQTGNEDRYRSLYGSGNIDAAEFGLDTDARFRSIDPTIGARSVNTQVAGGPNVGTNDSARTERYGTAQDAALDGLNGPDRTALAMQKLKDFDAVSEEQRFKEERALGQNIAKFGRSGMQANAGDFGEITRKIAGDRGRLANELAAGVAEGDIADRFRRVDATSGLRGQEAGLDASRRGEMRTDRDYGTGLDERNVGRALDDRDYNTGLAERNFGRATGERDAELGVNERNIGRRQSERDTRLGIATGNQDRAFDRTRAAIDTATGQTDRGIGDLYDQYNAAGSLEDRVFGQGQQNRGEYRTERGRQDQQSQQTIENRLREFQIQQELEDAKIRRAAALAQAGGLY